MGQDGTRKIVVAYPKITQEQKNAVRELAGAYGYEVSFYRTNQEALPAMADAEIAYGAGADLTKAAPKLRWFCSALAGVNAYLEPGAFASEDCLLTGASGAYGVTLAEHMVMLSLMVLRRMPEYMESVRNQEWKQGLEQGSLKDATVLVLGTGDIGTEYAKRVRGFAPKSIIGFNRSGRQAEGFDLCEKMENLDAYLPEADLVAACLPQTPDTVGAVSRARLALMKPTAYLVNAGRGSSIDQDALIEALNAGKIAGAALDVMTPEPLPKGHPLWTAKNILLTPHIAGHDTLAYTRKKNVEMFLEDLANYLEGKPLLHQVNRSRGY